MSMIERMSGGLTVVEHSQDSKQIEQALKQIDDRLLLWPPDQFTPYWQVLSRVSDWMPPVPVTVWMDDYGNPLPLSSGLIDRVMRLRPDAPNRGLSIDDHNRKVDERNERDSEARTQAVLAEHRPYVEKARTSVSFGPLTRLSEHRRPNRRRKP